MGGVFIAPNIKRESVRIDPQGNIINAKTREIIKPVEPEYVPPAALVAEAITKTEAPKEAPKSKLDEMIGNLVDKKIEEMVAKKVEEILNKL